MSFKCLFGFILSGWLFNTVAAPSFAPFAQATTNSALQTVNISQITNMDSDIKAMIDTWPKGASTNGLFCALRFIRNDKRGPEPRCVVHVVNTTTNFYRTFLNLPREVIFEVDLVDAQGKAVEKNASGKLFKPWTSNQVDEWLREQLRIRARNKYFDVYPFGCSTVNFLGIPEIFQLKEPGEYTLHLRMLLMEAKGNSIKDIQVQTTPLPEVVAKVQINSQDILKAVTH